MKFSKKSQIEHVFLYAFVLLVMGVLAVIGYKSISKITSAGCDAERATFRMDMISMLEKYDTRESVHIEKLKTPCSYRKICFLDADVILGNEGVPGTGPCNPASSPTPCLIRDAAITKTKSNVFLNKESSWEAIGFSEKVEVNATENFLCVNVKGSYFNIQFNGLGRRTRVLQG